jgi:hypothetical protein
MLRCFHWPRAGELGWSRVQISTTAGPLPAFQATLSHLLTQMGEERRSMSLARYPKL